MLWHEGTAKIIAVAREKAAVISERKKRREVRGADKLNAKYTKCIISRHALFLKLVLVPTDL